MDAAVIEDFVRTSISRLRPDRPDKDVFSGLRVDDLACICIRELIKRTHVPAAQIADSLIGYAFPVNENKNIFFPSLELEE